MTTPSNTVPHPHYRIMDSRAEAAEAIAQVLASAQTSLCIVDQSADSLSEREFGRPHVVEQLRKLLLANRSHKIRIALHDTQGIESELPRLVALLDTFSTQLSIQRTLGAAREIQDVMLIADLDAIWRKPVAAHPRSIVSLHDAAAVKPYLERFEEIWSLTENAVSSRGTGL
jgi:hypothetical protein